MRYAEVRRNILNTPSDYTVAISASADLDMNHGVIRQFCWKYPEKMTTLRQMYENELVDGLNNTERFIGKCVANPYGGHNTLCLLINRHHIQDRASYEMLALALHYLRSRCLNLDITKLAMPTIGCGSGGLKWPAVSRIIQGIFSDTDVDIMICLEPPRVLSDGS